MSSYIVTDESLCTSCNTCVRECVRHLPVSFRTGPAESGVDCSSCYHCVAVCPQKAIDIRFPGEIGEVEKLWRSDGVSYIPEEQLLSFLAYRRSVRFFQNREIDDNIVGKLIRSASFIPSGGNSHSYEFTLLERGALRDELLRELRRIYAVKRRILNNRVLRNIFTVFTDPGTREFLRDRTYLERITYLLDRFRQGEDPVFYGAPVVLFAHSKTLIPTPAEDSVLAAYNITLMAQSLGLGSCFVSLARNAVNSSRRCKKMLDMDLKDRVHAVLVLGYPAVKFLRVVYREPGPIHRLNGEGGKTDRVEYGLGVGCGRGPGHGLIEAAR